MLQLAMTQNERTRKYTAKFTRLDLRLKKEQAEQYKEHIINKGYNSFNEFINIIIAADIIQGGIIPDKKDIAQIIKEDIKADQ